MAQKKKKIRRREEGKKKDAQGGKENVSASQVLGKISIETFPRIKKDEWKGRKERGEGKTRRGEEKNGERTTFLRLKY